MESFAKKPRLHAVLRNTLQQVILVPLNTAPVQMVTEALGHPALHMIQNTAVLVIMTMF